MPSTAPAQDAPLAPADLPWTQSAAEVTSALEVDAEQGLTTDAAAQLRKVHGKNKLAESEAEPPWRILLRQLGNPLIMILALGAGISLYTGHIVDATRSA